MKAQLLIKATLAAAIAFACASAMAQEVVSDPLTEVNTTTIAANTGSTTSAVTAMNTNLGQLLNRIGSSIDSGNNKVANAVTETGTQQRNFDTMLARDQNIYAAQQSHQTPTTLCASAGAAGMVSAAQGSWEDAVAAQNGSASYSNAAVQRAVNGPTAPTDVDRARTSAIHATYCSSKDYAAYGGTDACPAVSQMPGADEQVSSLLGGAGPVGTPPSLTFSPAQVTAAAAYNKNLTDPSVGRQLSKGEARTQAGIQYIGIQTQYKAVQSAAAWPALQAAADRMPNPSTGPLIQQALAVSSAAAFYNRTASATAKSTGYMSRAELEAFEVGRRYANPDYESDLAGMSGDELARENIRVNAMNAYLLGEIRTELEQNNLIAGAQLASAARTEYGQKLTDTYAQVAASLARSGGHP